MSDPGHPGGGAESDTVDLGDLSDLADGQLRAFPDVGEYGVVVCRVEGQLCAVSDNCSHADSPLSEGRLRGAKLVCPLHGAEFDVRDGSHSGPPAWEGVPVHKVTETAGGALVDRSPTGDADDENKDVGGRFQTR